MDAMSFAAYFSSRRRLNWYLMMPKLAVGLIVLAVIGLIWILRHQETEEQKNTLIADMLWLEQNLRFHLDNHAESLSQWAIDLSNEREPEHYLNIRIQYLRRNAPDIEQIVWLKSGKEVKRTFPGGTFTPSAEEINSFERAERLGKMVFCSHTHAQMTILSMVVPIFHHNHSKGFIVARYTMTGLFKQAVPWWFTERYRLELIDSNNQVLLAHSHVEGESRLSYNLPFETFGENWQLKASAFEPPSNMAHRWLAVAIIVLALAVFWSLAVIRRHIQRRLAAEAALREEHAFRKAMEDSLTVGMRARDLNGRITYVNPAFCRLVGFTQDELIGLSPPMPYWAPEDIERTLQLHQAVLNGQAPAKGFDILLKRKDGKRVEALVYEAPLIDAQGRHTGWMGSVLDITERKKAEAFAREQQEKLQQTARLVTLGEMASALAHELNQPLAAISSYNTGCLNLLKNGLSSSDLLVPALEKLGAQAKRAGKIIRRVYDFVKKSEPRRIPCDMADIIDDSISFIEYETRRFYIHIERNIEEDLPLILGDKTMLEQVLLNLIKNALDAMRDLPALQRKLVIQVKRVSGNIQVSVQDHGPGLLPEIAEHLFTAFHSTKSEGLGIGLSICRSIIEFHEGHLWFERAPEGGAIFLFTVPIKDAA
jgi:two-component system, LuxR family, sensor histidine kinase DctS